MEMTKKLFTRAPQSCKKYEGNNLPKTNLYMCYQKGGNLIRKEVIQCNYEENENEIVFYFEMCCVNILVSHISSLDDYSLSENNQKREKHQDGGK